MTVFIKDLSVPLCSTITSITKPSNSKEEKFLARKKKKYLEQKTPN
jgi:hypothetical protein